MAKLTPITLPVVLRIGESEAEIGRIEVPLTVKMTSATRAPDGSVSLPVTAETDGPELRRRVAAFLREAAAAFEEEGPADGD
ncbi:hypothetical protein [Streptosporangium sp. V21-05]|uniref:hypothetical protein n=1 Tax=Streptosporangium sp. V21-05 TaxID=3446115 RepID=UPI003F52BF9C